MMCNYGGGDGSGTHLKNYDLRLRSSCFLKSGKELLRLRLKSGKELLRPSLSKSVTPHFAYNDV